MIGTYVIYFLWALIPLFFLLSLLWAYLERAAGQTLTIRLDDYWKQAGFTSLSWGIYVLIDIFVVQGSLYSFIEGIMPVLLFKLLLFPLVLLVLGTLVGGSKEIQIAKMTHVSRRPNRKI